MARKARDLALASEQQTLAAKKVILPRAVREKWIVGFTHDVPRFGRITEAEGRFRFEEIA